MAVKLKGIEPRRKALGLTQQDMAEKLFVNRATIAMWETGTALPRAALLPAIAKLLQCSIDDLYNYDTAREVASPCIESA